MKNEKYLELLLVDRYLENILINFIIEISKENFYKYYNFIIF